MKNEKSMFKTNIIYGLLAIIPLAIIVLLLAKIVEILNNFAESLGLQSTVGAGLAFIIGFLFLLVLCFTFGALLRTQIGAWSFERIESKVFNKIPGYEIIKNVLKGFAENKAAYPMAMVRLYESETAVLGFVTAENNNGTVTVFVPSSPAITVGSLYVVGREQVTILEVGTKDFVDCISTWGLGSRAFIGSKPV